MSSNRRRKKKRNYYNATIAVEETAAVVERKEESDSTIHFRVGITHSDRFHCDDVFSTAFLKILCPDITIFRKRKIEEELFNDPEVIIYDVGGGEFDHHGQDKELRPDGIPYASFGKLWRKYGSYVAESPKSAEIIDNTFVKWIDNTDNGGTPNPLTTSISAFNPIWDSNDSEEEKFFEAVDIAKIILKNVIEKKNAEVRADAYVNEMARIQRNGIVVLDHFVPFGNGINPDIYFIMYPDKHRNNIIMDCVRDKKSGSPKIPIPANWKRCTNLGIVSFGETRLHFDTLTNAIDAAMMLVGNQYTNTIDFEEMDQELMKNDFKVFDPKTQWLIQTYGLLEVDNGNGSVLCPILTEDKKLYSLSSITLASDNCLVLNDDYHGMIYGGSERDVDNVIRLHVLY